MKNFIYTIGASLICASALAQEATPGQTPEAMPPSSTDGLGQVAPPTVERASTQARNWLNRKGYPREGYFPEKDAFFAIGEATIAVGPDDPIFGMAREMAYEQAMLKCKEQLAIFIAAEIDRRISSITEKPNRTKTVSDSRKRLEALQKAQNATETANKSDLRDLSIMDKAGLLATSELDKILTDRGHIDPNDPTKEASKKQMEDAVKALKNPELVASQKFSDAKGLAARTEAAGMRALVTFEAIPQGKRGSIAVIGYISKSSKEMAKAMLGKAGKVVRQDKKKEPIGDWLNTLDASTLLFTHGVLSRYDEKGELWLIAFGQATPEFDDEDMADIARDEAGLNALAALRSFAGEALAMDKRKSTSLNMNTFAAEGRKTSKEYENSSSYKSTTTAVAAALKMPGSQPLRSWDYVHPQMSAAGIEIATCGVVYGWNVSSAEAALELGKVLESIGGSRGGAGRQLAEAAPGEGEAIPGGKKAGNPTSQGKGAEGEIDD
jgi:hypothetical protein